MDCFFFGVFEIFLSQIMILGDSGLRLYYTIGVQMNITFKVKYK